MTKSRFLFTSGLALVIGMGVCVRGATQGEAGIEEKLGAQAALDITLKDEQGNDVTLRQLVDKPTILTLNYFRCTGICTPLLNGIADVFNRIGIVPGKDFQAITVSFDPQDTPEIARQKKINYLKLMNRPVAPAAWRFLTGDAPDTRHLADSVGFRFRAQGDQFVHPGVVIVLTPKGIVSRYLYGISYLPADIEMAIREAEAGQVRPTISRILDFCYSFDPQSRRSVLNITRLAGAGILVLAGAYVVILLTGRTRSRKKKTRLSE
jgi:protein SCO1/2